MQARSTIGQTCTAIGKDTVLGSRAVDPMHAGWARVAPWVVSSGWYVPG